MPGYLEERAAAGNHNGGGGPKRIAGGCPAMKKHLNSSCPDLIRASSQTAAKKTPGSSPGVMNNGQ